MNHRRFFFLGAPLMVLVLLNLTSQAQEEPVVPPVPQEPAVLEPTQEPIDPSIEARPEQPADPLPGQEPGFQPAEPRSEVPTPRQEPGAPPAQPETPGLPPLIDSRQIDRYDAIQQLTESLQGDPTNLTDWIILGELSQEVAQELPYPQAQGYHRLARQAYESALTLAPNHPDIRAALDFAREEEENAETFHENQRRLTEQYLAARRQELARNQNRPSFRMDIPPRMGTTELPRAVDSAVGSARPQVPPDLLFGPTFQPYVRDGRPFTYQEYSRSYFPRGTLDPTLDRPNIAPPATFRNYIQSAPGMLGGEVQRGVEGMMRRGMGLPAPTTQPAPPR